MIKIVPGDVKEMYDRILSPRTLQELKSRGLDNDEIDKSVLTKILTQEIQKSFSSGAMPLPIPLKSVKFEFSSNGQSYWGDISFEKGIFGRDINMDKIRSRLNSCGFIDLGSNLVLTYEQKVQFGLMDKYTLMDMYFGSNGTVKRGIGSFDVFEAEIIGLCDVATRVTNAFYDGQTPDLEYTLNF